MIALFEQNRKTIDRQSSKGNQLKWFNDGYWYKADYTGYEGFSEYIISHLLQNSSLSHEEILLYETEEISYKNQKYLGCKSSNFLPQDWQLITLERLFHTTYGVSLYQSFFRIQGTEERIKFLVDQVVRMTDLKDFSIYLSKLLAIDAFFLNEDRHTHNIAVLLDSSGHYHYCPIFDNGASLLSDTTMDYPLESNIYKMISCAASKTICSNFDEQLDAIEHLYGQHIKFTFTQKNMEDLISKEEFYSDSVKERVFMILSEQLRKYRYLF